MAQVRKFQDGGKTFTLGGYTFNTNNAEDMKMLEEMASNSTYGGIAQSVLDNVRNGSYANTLKMYRTADGRVVMEGGLQDVADQHLSSGTQKALQRKDTYINNLFKRQSAKDWANNTDAFLSEISRRKTVKPVESSPKHEYKITGVSDIHDGQIRYDDNTSKWISNLENTGQINQLQLLEDYYHSNEEGRKKYDVSALDSDALSRWLEWRKTQGEDKINWNTVFNSNSSRLPDNDLFYQNYGWFGFNSGKQEEIEERKAEAKAKTTKAEIEKQFEGVDPKYIVKNDDGSFSLTDNAMLELSALTGTNISKTGNYWFNQDWSDFLSKQGKANPFSKLLDYVFWQGKLYKADDADFISKYLNPSDYLERIKEGDAAKADNILRTWWSVKNWNPEGGIVENHPFQTIAGYSPYTVKNRYVRQIDTTDGSIIVEQSDIDPNSPYGNIIKTYKELDSNGFHKKDVQDNDPRIARDVNGAVQYSPQNTFGRTIDEHGQVLWSDGMGYNGDYQFYLTPNYNLTNDLNQNSVLGTYYMGKSDSDTRFRIPAAVWNAIQASPILTEMQDDPELANSLWNALSWVDDSANYNSSANAAINRIISNEKWADIKNALLEFIKQKNDSSLGIIPSEYAIKVTSNKQGGILKFQKGGQKVATKERPRIKPLPKLNSANSGDFTEADKWELRSLIADSISAIATLIDPTNISGVVSGLAGTGTRFVADVKRDGLDWGDVGGGLVSLIGDLGTGIPIIGDALAASRIGKIVSKAAPLILKGLKVGAIYGVTTGGIALIEKIISGEELTKDDWRNALNVFNGIRMLKHTGFKSPKTKTEVENFGDFKSSAGDKSVKLSQTAIDKISAAEPSKQMRIAKKELIAAHKAKYNDSLPDNEILKLYDIPSTTTGKKWYLPWKRVDVPNMKKSTSRTVLDYDTDSVDNVTRIRTKNPNPGRLSRWYDQSRLKQGIGKVGSWFGKLEPWYNASGTKQQATWEQAYGQNRTWTEYMLPNKMNKPVTPGTEIELFNPSTSGQYRIIFGDVPEVVATTYKLPNKYLPFNYIMGDTITPNESDEYNSSTQYKKGGVLKGQDGLKPWEVVANMGDYVTKRIPILKGQNTPVTTGTGGTPTATTPATTGGTTGTTGTGTTAATTGTATNTTFKEKTPEELAKMSMAERMSYDHQKQLHQQNQKKTQTVSSQDGSITSMHPVASSSGRTLKQGETIVDVMSADAKAATSHTPAPAEVTGQFSGRVDSDTNEYLRKAEQSRNRNRLTQLFAADLQRRMGNQFADKIRNNLLMNRVVSPNLSWNQRWIDPRGNQAERLGASLLTSANQFNTADSGLNRAAKLDMLGKIGQIGMNNIDQQANAFNAQLDATNQRNMQQRIMNAQTRTQNNQIMSNAYMASDQQRYGANNVWLTTTSNIFDKIEAEDTTKWNKLGQTKANLEMQASRYDALAASATDEKTKSAYQAMAANLRDPKTLELYLNSGGYSTQSAKKGAKLRPMHEQMLIDKQKLVAKAIEKINDNTMKILLKAMS